MEGGGWRWAKRMSVMIDGWVSCWEGGCSQMRAGESFNASAERDTGTTGQGQEFNEGRGGYVSGRRASDIEGTAS